MSKEVDFFFTHNGVEVPAKRLVVWIPEPVHRAIKAEAISMATEMGAIVSAIVEDHFAEHDVFVDWPDPVTAPETVPEKVDAG